VLYANRRSGATTGAWPGYQTFCGWKGSGVDSKGGLGPYTIPRYMREQSLTIMQR
jgi:1-pyrroline-5-carboxylate dehydrogenase